MEKLNTIVIDGKVFEATPEVDIDSCLECNINLPRPCMYAEVCSRQHCIFRYSQSLTDKLIKAASDASDNAVFDSNNWNNYNEGFIKGAEWLMTQPLADRLTKEEKEKINALYNDLKHLEIKVRIIYR